jgi:hypothetical protein
MVEERRNEGQGEGDNPNPQGQNMPNQPKEDQGEPDPGRAAAMAEGAPEIPAADANGEGRPDKA